MHNIGIIALDLDGTLLDSQKQLSSRNFAALQRAANLGIQVVPTTGRFYGGMPEMIRKLPFVRYVISVNGAEVLDTKTGEVLYKAELPWTQAVEIMEFFDTLPVIYDCFMDGKGWMTEGLKAKIDETVDSPHYVKMLHELRQSVPELKAFLKNRKQDVQKVQFFTRDEELRQRLLKTMEGMFPEVLVSSSAPQNLEVNQKDAHKGKALLALADHLGIPREGTMAVGDGLNDVSMLRAAGIGVAMKNGCEEVLAAGDYITDTNDADGVAKAIEKFCF